MSGIFITFEGIDGCGKSTQAKLLHEVLVKHNIASVLTREPGGTPLCDTIRELILSPTHTSMSNECELFLYLASRAQHCAEKIIPLLAANTVVLCDRFQEATFAYQGAGRGIDLTLLEHLNAFATQKCVPDLTIIFDLSVDEAQKRLTRTGKAPDRLEGAGRAFFERVRAGYLTLARKAPERITVLDATHSIDTLKTYVLLAVKNTFTHKGIPFTDTILPQEQA